MFSYFVTFQEVVKLSPKIWNEQKAINYDKDTLKLIFEKEDAISLDSIFDLLDMDLFIRQFYEYFKSIEHKSRQWKPIDCRYDIIDFLSEVIRVILKHMNYSTDDPVIAPMENCYGLFSLLEFHLIGKKRKLTFNDLKTMMLTYSVEVDDLELLKYLKSKGADLNVKKGYILEIAISKRRFGIIRYLRSNGVNINTAEALWSARNEVTTLKYLIDAGQILIWQKSCLKKKQKLSTKSM